MLPSLPFSIFYLATLVVLVSCGDSDLGATQSVSRGTQCGPTLDFTPVNQYTEPLLWVQDREESVVFINGNCTGTLLDVLNDDVHLILTAGHCVGLGDEALIVFNFEDDADGPDWVTGGTVVEQSDLPDYALIELLEDPGVRGTRLENRWTRQLTVIQHPRGMPKVVASGFFSDLVDGEVSYFDLDTLVGSSGGGLLNTGGRLAGIHTGGDCTGDTGTNQGWTIEAIIEASERLTEAMLDPC